MKTSRQKILDYLRIHRTCTASELSRVMQMTSANARHHLKILVDQGTVIQSGERMPVHQRGRPERIYHLADAMRQNNLGFLASLLLQEIIQPGDPEESDSLLRTLANRIVESSGGEASQQRSLGPRLVQAVQILSRLNYQARWEARPGAPEIYFGICPYKEIITGHPELCRMDSFLLQQLTGHPVEHTARLAPDHSGGQFCRFLLHAS